MITSQCDVITEDHIIPGFVHVKAKFNEIQKQRHEVFRSTDNILIGSQFSEILYVLIQDSMAEEALWDSLHFYLDQGPVTFHRPLDICSIQLRWTGKYYPGLTISVDLATDWWPKDIRERSELLPVAVKEYGSLVVISKCAPRLPLMIMNHFCDYLIPTLSVK